MPDILVGRPSASRATCKGTTKTRRAEMALHPRHQERRLRKEQGTELLPPAFSSDRGVCTCNKADTTHRMIYTNRTRHTHPARRTPSLHCCNQLDGFGYTFTANQSAAHQPQKRQDASSQGGTQTRTYPRVCLSLPHRHNLPLSAHKDESANRLIIAKDRNAPPSERLGAPHARKRTTETKTKT